MEHVKLLSTTAILTALIWTAADSLVNENAKVPITLRIIAPADQSDVLVNTTESESYQLHVVGPRKSIAKIQRLSPVPVRLQTPELPLGLATLPLKELIQEQWKDYPELAVVAVEPAQTTILVDRLIQREVTLTTNRLTLPYDTRPQLQPGTIRVRFRESRLKEFAPSGELQPWDVSGEVEKLLKNQPVGQGLVAVLTLDESPFGPDAGLVPQQVEVRASLAALRKLAEVPTVPILLAVSFANLPKGYRVIPRDGDELVTQTIKVLGPKDDVDRLIRGETRAIGLIHLKDEHLVDPGVFKPFTPEFQLPPGLELAEKPRPIELQVAPPAKVDDSTGKPPP